MKLERSLNLYHVFAIGMGAMLSSVFILPGMAYEKAGPAILISFFLAALMAAPGMLSLAELTSAMPKAGGTYFYVTRAMGPMVGAVYGMITWFSLALKSSYELIFVGMIFRQFFGFLNVPLTAAIVCVLFLVINAVGVKQAGKVQGVLAVIVLGALAFYLARGFPVIRVSNFDPFVTHGYDAVLVTAGFVFISYGGFLKVASVAEEVRRPGRVVPLGMIFALAAITVTYLTVIYVTIGVEGQKGLAGSTAPIADGAALFLGSRGAFVFTIVGLLAIASAANTGILSASRYPLALARDGVIPEALGAVNERFHTPHVSIFFTGVVVIIALFMPIDLLVKSASGVLILTFIFTNLTVIILREGRVQNYQPEFRSPLYPWAHALGSVALTVVLLDIGNKALVVNGILILFGVVMYWLFGRIQSTREYALLHVLDRITPLELTSRSLESELKEIIRERDDIFKDRFDRIVETCPILDIKEAVYAHEFFDRAAGALSERFGLDRKGLLDKFEERERESTTVLSTELAIPHVIIDGEKQFEILLARCRDGIHFSDEAPAVRTVFMLVGTRDERPFHLRALAAIAQVAQDPQFDTRWKRAKNAESLRDVVLLAKRKRIPE